MVDEGPRACAQGEERIIVAAVAPTRGAGRQMRERGQGRLLALELWGEVALMRGGSDGVEPMAAARLAACP